MFSLRSASAKTVGNDDPGHPAVDAPAAVLVVDDDAAERRDLVSALSARGYRVLEAGSLADAKDQATATPPETVILGGGFSEAEGEACCRALRAAPGCEDLPVLMVTSGEDPETLERAFGLGATDILVRPVNAALLCHRVTRMLESFARLRSLHEASDQTEGAFEAMGLLSRALGGRAERLGDKAAASGETLIEKEREFRQSHKMEALGQMAGGVAHEFNNQLTVISGFGRAALGYINDPKRVRECLVEVVAASDRAAILTSQMLLFSRDHVLSPRVIHIREVIENMHAVLRWAAGGSTDLVLDIDNADAIARVDPVQLSQAVLNLAVNAHDAMPKGGRLKISCDTVELGTSTRISHYPGPVKPGAYVRLAIKDSGTGMDRETLERMFDPFFTTKDVGKGTGLGLSVVFGIVEQCGGMIDVDSAPGVGTTFTLYFPVSSEPPERSVEEETHDIDAGAGGTILLVEDEPAVLELVSMSLRCAGYDVLPAHDGLEAVQVIEQAGQEIDLFVSDVVMPGLSGKDLADIFERECPGKPVLFTSGYAPVIEEYLLRSDGKAEFIGKPFKPWDLVEKVNKLMAMQARTAVK